MNLKFETIVQILRKIIQLNAVIILKKVVTNTIDKLSQKVAAKWTFILLWGMNFQWFVPMGNTEVAQTVIPVLQDPTSPAVRSAVRNAHPADLDPLRLG